MSRLYGIWYADYSNSSVGGAVYSSRDDAVAVARETGGDVAEFDVDPLLSEKAKKLRRPGERFFNVTMLPDGNEAQAYEEYPAEELPDESSSVRVTAAGEVVRTTFSCWASDEKHAIKIANDRRRQWIAAGEQFDPIPQKQGGFDAGWRRVLP